MSVLSTLNVVQSDTAALRLQGMPLMRQKLLNRIDDQIALAEAQASGQSYHRVKFKRAKDGDGQADMPVNIRVRPWWVQDKDGSLLVWIKYGNQVFELQKGKTTIKIKGAEELVPTFKKIAEGVRAGEFDELIKAAVSNFKTRFKK